MRFSAPLLFSLIVLAACSSDDGDDTGPLAPAGPQIPSAAASSVEVGGGQPDVPTVIDIVVREADGTLVTEAVPGLAVTVSGANGGAETTITVPVDQRRMEMLKSAAYVGFDAEAFAPESPDVLTANNSRRFDLQLIADFTFTIQP